MCLHIDVFVLLLDIKGHFLGVLDELVDWWELFDAGKLQGEGWELLGEKLDQGLVLIGVQSL